MDRHDKNGEDELDGPSVDELVSKTKEWTTTTAVLVWRDGKDASLPVWRPGRSLAMDQLSRLMICGGGRDIIRRHLNNTARAESAHCSVLKINKRARRRPCTHRDTSWSQQHVLLEDVGLIRAAPALHHLITLDLSRGQNSLTDWLAFYLSIPLSSGVAPTQTVLVQDIRRKRLSSLSLSLFGTPHYYDTRASWPCHRLFYESKVLEITNCQAVRTFKQIKMRLIHPHIRRGQKWWWKSTKKEERKKW